MKSRLTCLARCACASIALLQFFPRCLAQDTDNVKLLQKTYSEIAAVLSVDPAGMSRTGGYLVLTPTGGIPIDDALSFDNNADRATIINTLFDVRVQESWILSTTPGRISDVYEQIINFSATPAYRLTPAEEAEYRRVESILYEERRGVRRPTELLDFFREAEDDLLAAIQEIEIFQNESPGQPVPRSLTRVLQRARDQYENDAQGPTVEAYLRRHRELQQKLGGDLFRNLRLQWDAFYNQTNDFNEVQLNPKYDSILRSSPRGWSKVTITSEELETRTRNSRTSFTGRLSGGYGLWWGGGKYSRDTERKYFQSETSGLTIEMEVMKVIVRYPWMEFDVFGARNWKWGRSSIYYPNRVVSDGSYNPSTAGDELVPFIPVSMVVARGIKLTGNWSSEVTDFFSSQENSKGSYGWGPFTLGGYSYNKSEQNEYKLSKKRGNTIEAPEGVQVLGYFVAQVPKSPDPDSTLPWGERFRSPLRTLGFVDTGKLDSPFLNRADSLMTRILEKYESGGIKFDPSKDEEAGDATPQSK